MNFEQYAPRNVDKSIYFNPNNNFDYDNVEKAKDIIMKKLGKGSVQFVR